MGTIKKPEKVTTYVSTEASCKKHALCILSVVFYATKNKKRYEIDESLNFVIDEKTAGAFRRSWIYLFGSSMFSVTDIKRFEKRKILGFRAILDVLEFYENSGYCIDGLVTVQSTIKKDPFYLCEGKLFVVKPELAKRTKNAK